MAIWVLKRGLWQMLPIAIGLHVVALSWPVPSNSPAEVIVKKTPKPVPIVTASKSPTPTPSATPQPAIVPPPTQPSPSSAPLISSTPSAPVPTPSTPSAPIPVPSTTPPPTPPPEALQLPGAVACQAGSTGCFRVTETNGRTVSLDLEDQLLKQGFSASLVELANDTGKKAYEVSKDGRFQYYLFMTWDSDGTVYQKLLTKNDLEAKIASS